MVAPASAAAGRGAALPLAGRRRSRSVACAEECRERSVSFRLQQGGGAPLFYRPASRIIRDLGVLALAAHGRQHQRAPRVLDAMSGSGVRALRYSHEANASFVHANERMFGEHPLRANLEPLLSAGRARVTADDAVDVYMRSRLDGSLYDLVDADAFGTGQPHAAEAWWACRTGGLVYLCATDSLTTSGSNPHQAAAGYAAVTHKFPGCNEAGLRLLVGTAAREAAARHLTASPVFSFFHRPSSTFRVMMRLDAAKRPPASAFAALSHVARCPSCGEVMGPMWVGPMHDAEFVAGMRGDAAARGWSEPDRLLGSFLEEAEAEAKGALLFYHLGEVQRALAKRGLRQPPLAALLPLLRGAGFGAAQAHSETKSLKTSATLDEVVRVVSEAKHRAGV
ncbi:hypothetical protein EMIHUDRAFT_464575 [Emiliania huxleyi CCMP1516]|uniref:Uncharacterized protein n=2 Tax=Emiliania huxleyi TaxID=2903 RepID=A0A0D3IRZ9_EMIH1|nr:hypothetical protein EMIHUDRAFT_464575 [Emiliania huxleyi CCMP1516]EOD14034.1 hypothetical protein EMIHUDRAFT_464575 [Emiliania huxleyi CCMP1516]|eukprot:XP_005766463.1 hypothetical protein EMIHUDRAFT_464575 [Emiliania huxleyi CCMP1516]